MKRYFALPLILWVQQIGCVIGGTLPWYGVFMVPAMFAVGAGACWAYWRRRDRRDFPRAKIHSTHVRNRILREVAMSAFAAVFVVLLAASLAVIAICFGEALQ